MTAKSRKCIHCKTRNLTHFNQKYCPSCVKKGFRIGGHLTEAQERIAMKWKGKMYIHHLAEKVGVSKPTLTRWARRKGVTLNALAYSPSVIREVCKFYEKHGKVKTEKKFKDICLRSIIDRYYKEFCEPRQIRWKPGELIEAAKMYSLVPFEDQANFFNRPNANGGSIRSLWTKRFGKAFRYLNGLPHYIAVHYVTEDCPRYRIQNFRWVVLWIDVENHLKPDVPDYLVSAIKSIAKFQKLLHGRYYRKSIKEIIERGEGKPMSDLVKSEKKASILEKRDEFDTRNVVNTLEGLMNRVTKDKVDPDTVNAACNCADKIVDILRLHLDVERLRRKTDPK